MGIKCNRKRKKMKKLTVSSHQMQKQKVYHHKQKTEAKLFIIGEKTRFRNNKQKLKVFLRQKYKKTNYESFV